MLKWTGVTCQGGYSGSSFSGENCCFVCRECMNVGKSGIFLWLSKARHFKQQELAEDPAFGVRCCYLMKVFTVTWVEENNREQWEDGDELGICNGKYTATPDTGSFLIILPCRQEKIQGRGDRWNTSYYFCGLFVTTNKTSSAFFFLHKRCSASSWLTKGSDPFTRPGRWGDSICIG